MINNTSSTFKVFMTALFAGLILFSLWQLYILYANGETTMATIEKYHETPYNPQSLTGSEMTYTPVFSFLDVNGKKLTLRSGTSSRKKKYAIGESVKVIYPKDKPIAAQITGYLPFKMYLMLLGLGFMGIVFIRFDFIKNAKQ